MKNTKRFLLVVAVVLSVVLGPFGIACAITNGQPDGDGHPYVGLVHDWMWACSGAAISPYVFVTAAHCFDIPGQPVVVTFHPDGYFADDPEYKDGHWYPHPDFCPGCGPGLPGSDSHDVAVVVFDEPVYLPEYAELPTEGLVDTLPNKTDLTVVGYGRQFDSGGGPRYPHDGVFTRHYAPSELIASDHVHSDEFIKITLNPGGGKGGICFGDSGGPDLLGDTPIILAVNSYGTNYNCAGVGYSNRIDTEYALEFITGFLSP